MKFAFLLLVSSAVLSVALHAQNSRGEKLRRGLQDTELVGTWIYDDLEAGFNEADRTGKPLLIVFR